MISKNISTKILGNEIKYLETIDSTNNELWKHINKCSLKEGYTIIANNQTSGRGRRGNKWISSKSESLTFSILLKPKLNIKTFGLVSILTSISIVEAIKYLYNINTKIKWPNDILAKNKKIGGILVESKIINDETNIVIGIGINVNQKLMLNELKNKAISIRMINQKINNIELLFKSILNQLEKFYNMPSENWITVWQENCAHINSKIKFHENNEIFEGIFIGLSKNGEAIIKKNGSIQIFPSGVLNLI